MTTNRFDGLGERLDTIASAHTDHVELRHPGEVPIESPPEPRRERVMWLLAAAAVLAIAAAVLVLRDGADLQTEEPAADPDAVVTLGSTRLIGIDDLPAVFRLDPLPEDDPAVLAKDGWWTQWTIRRVDFDGGSVFVASGGEGVGVLCVDVQLDGEDTLAERMDGSCTSVSGFLADAPLRIAPDAGPPVVAGVVPIGASGVTVDGGDVQIQDGVYFALLDRPGAIAEPIRTDELGSASVGSVSGAINGVGIDAAITQAGCFQWQLGDWFVSASGPEFWMRFSRLDFVISATDPTIEPAAIQRFTVNDETSPDGTMRLRVAFDQADTEGVAVFDCTATIDFDEYLDRWYLPD